MATYEPVEQSTTRYQPVGQDATPGPTRYAPVEQAMDSVGLPEITQRPRPRPSAFFDLGKKSGPITRETILKTPEYMSAVKQTMASRFGVDQRSGLALDWKYDESMTDEQMLDMWLNYNRAFAAGQTVHTAGEIAYIQRATEDEKEVLARSYTLFDNMENSLIGEGVKWTETFDSIGDYAWYSVVDPTTAIGLGVGRVATKAGGKAVAITTKEGMKKALQAEIKAGATSVAAKAKVRQVAGKAFATRVATKGAVLAAVDLPASVGADYFYQMAHIGVGVQEKYSYTQGAISALGTMILPAVYAGFKGINALSKTNTAGKLGLGNYVDVTKKLKGQMSKTAVEKAVLDRANKDLIQDKLGILFGDMVTTIQKDAKWKGAGDVIQTTKPTLKTDNPGGQWLASKQRAAKTIMDESDPNTYGKNLGNTVITGYFEKPIALDPKALKDIAGAAGEEAYRTDSPKLTGLKDSIKTEGYKPTPIMIHVRDDGTPFIVEGNHRLAEALESGRESIDVEIKYLRGGETAQGLLNPDNLPVPILRKDNDLQAATRTVNAESKGVVQTGDDEVLFWKTLMNGNEDEGIIGLTQILAEAGVVYVPRGADDTPTNFFGDIISLLPKEFTKNIDEQLELIRANRPDLIPTQYHNKFGTEELGDYFKKTLSNAGKTLAVVSVGARRAGQKGLTNEEVARGFKIVENTKESSMMAKLRYTQSAYKRLLTSHPGTTALNVKGWSVTVAANAVSDIVAGALYAGTGQLTKAKGSVLGAMRTGANILNHIDTFEAAEKYLEIRPEIAEKLHQYIAGGVESNKNLKELFKRHQMDPNSKFNTTVEGTVSTIQALAGVKLQDELTKQISFMSALDKEIMKTFGMNYNQFMSQPDAYVKMYTKEFHLAENRALDRTIRDTYSKSYSLAPGKGTIRRVARLVEDISDMPGVGVMLPFGQFFNNATAILGDYSGINLLLHAGFKTSRHQSERDWTEVASRAAVGWAAMVGYFIPNAWDKIDEGLRWNQHRDETGALYDSTYDAPLPYAQILGQMIAHYRRDGEVPADLLVEAFDFENGILFGQAFRDLGQTAGGFGEMFKSLLGSTVNAAGEFDINAFKLLADMAQGAEGFVGKAASGATRFLDPINQFTAVISDSYETPDRRQGIEAWNNGIRYIDQIFDIGTSPEQRNSPTNEPADQDLGKMFGMRSAQPPSPVEKMLASIGKPTWKAVKWPGDNPQIKNTLDRIVEPYLNMMADEVLRTDPEFFSKSQADKEKILQKRVMEPAKEMAKEFFESSRAVDPALKIMNKINAKPAKEIDRAMRFFSVEGTLADIAVAPGGPEALDMILFYLENPEYFEDLE